MLALLAADVAAATLDGDDRALASVVAVGVIALLPLRAPPPPLARDLRLGG